MLLLLAALLPGLFWDQPADTAPKIKEAGIQRLYVPADLVDAWRAAGVVANAFDPKRQNVTKVEPPGVKWRANIASATNSPWLDANGWRFLREERAHLYYCETPKGAAALAQAEAYAYGVDEVIHPDPADLEAFGRMASFLRSIDRPRLPALANIGVIDDGSDEMGEIMNLLTRRNLLFRPVLQPDPRYDLIVRKPEKPVDPHVFAVEIRQKLTDEKRLVRLYGSEVVIARLTGDGPKARLHLINYSGRPVNGLRVRVLGEYPHGTAQASGIGAVNLLDYQLVDRGTEFTLPPMGVYTVVDLEK